MWGFIHKPAYPAYSVRCSTRSKYPMNCFSRVHGEGTFWLGTNKRKQTYDLGRGASPQAHAHCTSSRAA